MCGIVGYVGNKNALNVLIDGLNTLEYRGYDSAGVAFIKNNIITVVKEKGKIENLTAKLDFSIESNLGIGHTRWATHGEPSVANSHPHKVGNITIVHNGIIENYDELKEFLIECGYNFKSETDTEVACALIDKLYSEKKDILKVLNKAIEMMRGSYALGIICDDEVDTLYAVRKDSPLIVAMGDGENYIASDVPAILKYTNKYSLLNNNEIAVIKRDSIKFFKGSEEINKEVLEFKWSLDSAMKNGFEHFMLKEIFEQPDVVKETINSFISEGYKSLFKSLPDFSKYEKIDIIACGSAAHAGMVGKVLLEKYANLPVYVETASEYRYKKLFTNSRTLVIVISQSGETADSLAALRISKDLGADTLAIVNVVGSSIAREADYLLYTKAGCEIAVATTKAYSAQVATLSLIALNIAISKDILKETDFSAFACDVKELYNQMKQVLDMDLSSSANVLYEKNDIFFIGRGVDFALAMEASLKLKEISYIHSEAYAAGELKHGTISLIDKGTPVIAIVTDSEVLEKTISNIKEVKARGAYVILIIKDELDKDGDFYDQKIVIPSTNELLMPLLTILPLQVISYEVAKLRGCDIDKPRNLAKSVTVE